MKKSFKLKQKIELSSVKGTHRFMHEEVKFKGPSGSMVECSIVF